METFRDNVGGHREYTREGIIEIEDALIWLEANMRDPQINCLEGWGIQPNHQIVRTINDGCVSLPQ